MQKVIQGVAQFRNQVFSEKAELFARLKDGQEPLALFITCSDSRVCPQLITQSDPGDLFVLRNAGNIVPPHGAVPGGGEACTIEYAVKALQVSDIVICGHSGCGAVTALMHPEKAEGFPAVQSALKYAEATREIMNRIHADVTDDARRIQLAIEQNVLVQLENLKTHPSVAAALAAGTLTLHGWVYQMDTGDVSEHQSQSGRFVDVRDLSDRNLAQN